MINSQKNNFFKQMMFLSIALSSFIIAFDATITNIALPKISNDFKISIDVSKWIVSSYSLSFASFLLISGMISDKYGSKRVFMHSMFYFLIGSLLCSLSWDYMIIGRILQGFSSALMIPSSMSLITLLYNYPKERTRKIGIWGVFQLLH